MKKKLIFALGAALCLMAYAPTTSAQENLFDNPGFEEWEGVTLKGKWKYSSNVTLKQETDIMKNGNYALKVETAAGSTFNVGTISQDIDGTFQQGDVYEVTIHYYTISNGGSSMNRLRVNHRWNNFNDPAEPFYNSYEMPVGQWTTQTAEVAVANEGASQFNFIMETDPGTILIFDDFCFKKKEGVHTPYLTVSPETFPLVETTVGKAVKIGTAIVKYGNLPHPLDEELGTLYLSGSNRDQFKMNIIRDEEGEMELELIYAPNKTAIYSNHTAKVIIDSQVEGLGTKSISLNGKAYTEDTPLINIDRTEVVFPETAAGQTRRDTVYISSQNMREEIKAVIIGDSTFTISTNYILVNQENQRLGIAYRPVKAGTHTATITLTSKDAETKTIQVTGTATGDITNPDKQGDEYPLDVSTPVTLLHETFDKAPHNEPLAIEGWKNIAELNYRAWWGYDFNSPLVPDAVRSDEQVAKATLFNSLNPTAAPYEMWLYTPALDFKNAASKVFTFRVSATMLSDEIRNDSIELYYVEPDTKEANGLFRQKVDMYMPSKAEDNDEWFEYHIDLGAESNNVADTFFMAFRVSGTGGNASAASYYIDDVSFGRTDLPKISIENNRIAFESQPNAVATTPDINVSAQNLEEPIALSVWGTDNDKFKTLPATLPTEGGTFKIEFSSDRTGMHYARIKLASRGAADVYIDVQVNNKMSSGLDELQTDTRLWSKNGVIYVSATQAANIQLFDLSGHKIGNWHIDAGCTALPYIFNSGMYIVKMVQENDSPTFKVQVK